MEGEHLIPWSIEALPDCNFPVYKNQMTKCNYANWCFSLGVYKCRWIHLCPFKGDRDENNLQRILKQKERKPEKLQAPELLQADPDCEHNIVGAPGGGIKCTKCLGWFCY